MDDHQSSSPLNNYYYLDHDHHLFHPHHDHQAGSSSPSSPVNTINGADWSFQTLKGRDETPKSSRPVAPSSQEAVPCVSAGIRVMRKSSSATTEVSLTKRKTCKAQKRNTNSVKDLWNGEEDRVLIELVNKHGLGRWAHIAQMLPGRIGKQCRERWHNHLRPHINKDTWSDEEDRVLISAHVAIGNKWAEIAKRLPGRTENSIKNHWNATKRRQQCGRSNKPSLLLDYMKTLSFSPTTQTTPFPVQDQDHDHDGELLDFCFGKDGPMFHECGSLLMIDDHESGAYGGHACRGSS